MSFKINLPAHLLMDRQLISDRIKRLREARGWTQEQLAEHSGLHRNSIIRMETSERGLSIDAYLVVADALEIPLWRLFRDEDE
ncbi:helix-turn-helix domain-containing protein [Kitasatospora cineracea]|uniref:helix-turn-helix domain-containing protein n=1 Tax=Kitasatospora cineracea TaxID=88074 RepID=UPI0037886337